MSERRDDAALDALIDEAARSLIASSGPANLRARVLDRIHQRDTPSWRATWLVPVAAAAVLVAAVFLWSGRSSEVRLKSDPTPVDVAAVGSDLSRTSPASEVSRTSAPAAEVGADLSRTSPVVEIVEAELPPGIDSIAISQSTVPDLGVETLDVLPALNVESIPMESISVDALGAN